MNKNIFKKIIIYLTSITLILSFNIFINKNKVKAYEENIKISNLKNLDNLINFSEIEQEFNLSSKKFISAKKLESENSIVGIIDFYDETLKTNYTLFVNPDRKIEIIATEKLLNNQEVEINFYTWLNNHSTLKYKGIFNKISNELKNLPVYEDRISEDTSKLLLNWACTFSSFLACKTVGYAVGASGMLGGIVLGGLSISAGFLVNRACTLVFNTLVNQFGGKDAACGFIKSSKQTWHYFNN